MNLGPLHGEHRVSATGPPGNLCNLLFKLYKILYIFVCQAVFIAESLLSIKTSKAGKGLLTACWRMGKSRYLEHGARQSNIWKMQEGELSSLVSEMSAVDQRCL